MQAGAVVVAIQVGDLEGKVAEGVRAIHNHGDIARVRHLADPAHGEDLAGAVGDVAQQDHFGARRDGLLEALVEIVHGGRRHRKGNRLEHDAFAALALAEGGEHARIVLIGGQDFVAAMQVDAVLRIFQRLRWHCA